MVGYVFLVDGKGRARWRYVLHSSHFFASLRPTPHAQSEDDLLKHVYRGTGRPTEEEIGSMLRCTHELREEAQASVDSRTMKLRYGKFGGGPRKG